MEDLGKLIVLPIALIIVLYIAYILVSSLTEITPEFGDVGWYIFGAMVSAVVIFIGVAWLKLKY